MLTKNQARLFYIVCAIACGLYIVGFFASGAIIFLILATAMGWFAYRWNKVYEALKRSEDGKH